MAVALSFATVGASVSFGLASATNLIKNKVEAYIKNAASLTTTTGGISITAEENRRSLLAPSPPALPAAVRSAVPSVVPLRRLAIQCNRRSAPSSPIRRASLRRKALPCRPKTRPKFHRRSLPRPCRSASSASRPPPPSLKTRSTIPSRPRSPIRPSWLRRATSRPAPNRLPRSRPSAWPEPCRRRLESGRPAAMRNRQSWDDRSRRARLDASRDWQQRLVHRDFVEQHRARHIRCLARCH